MLPNVIEGALELQYLFLSKKSAQVHFFKWHEKTLNRASLGTHQDIVVTNLSAIGKKRCFREVILCYCQILMRILMGIQ